MPDNRELLALLDSIERALDEGEPVDDDPATPERTPRATAPRGPERRSAPSRREPAGASVVRLHPSIADVGITSAPRPDRDPPRTGVVPVRLTTRAAVTWLGKE